MEQAGIFGALDQIAYWGQLVFLWCVPLLLLWKFFAKSPELGAWTMALVSVNAVLLLATLCALVVILLPMILGLAEGEEHFRVLARMSGPYEWAFWPYLCCLLLPFLLLDGGMRRSWRIAFLLSLFFAMLPFLVEAFTWVMRDTIPAAWEVFPTVAQITLIWVLLSVPVAAALRTRERRLRELGR